MRKIGIPEIEDIATGAALLLANDVPGKDKIIGNIQECRARKAPVVAVIPM